jgi:hypothetical protein
VVSNRNTCHFRIGKGLDFLAERALGEENQVDLPNGVLAIRNLPGKAVLRRCDLQFAARPLLALASKKLATRLNAAATSVLVSDASSFRESKSAMKRSRTPSSLNQ